MVGDGTKGDAVQRDGIPTWVRLVPQRGGETVDGDPPSQKVFLPLPPGADPGGGQELLDAFLHGEHLLA